jgi:predicted O-linked N-acetylglucosamine transferase (SPINDLY family)
MLAKLINQVAGRWIRPDADLFAKVPALVAGGQSEKAERLLRRRLARNPADANALNYLGLICDQRGEQAEAVRYLAQAVELAPEVGFFQANLGEACRADGQLTRAQQHARIAVSLEPQQTDFAYNLGNILFQSHEYAEALLWAEKALAARPDWVEALVLAAKLDFELGHLGSALSRYERGLALRPDDPEMLLALERGRTWASDWRHDVAALSRVLTRWAAQPLAPEFGGLDPFVAYQFALPQSLRTAVLDAHVTRLQHRLGTTRPQFDFRARKPGSRIRIGYVSADYHSHPTMHLMAGLFRLHDRERFEITAYSIGADDKSAYRRQAVADADRFIDIRDEGVVESAQRIFDDGIDILVDLKGFTIEARLEIFALKPAPLRVTWLGYPASTGTGLNDYAIVDKVVAPPEHAAHFGEQLVYMPHSYQINDNRQAIAGSAPSRDVLGLPRDGFVFACFNHVYKIEATMFGCWMRILSRVEGSVLWLYKSNDTARKNLEREAAKRGIDPARLVFGGTLPKAEHLARLSRADLFLDTLLINAHTGASDALWAGLPLISCPQEGFPSRVGASLLSAAGLPQLVCASLAEYEELAVRLAGAPAELQMLRRQLSTAHEKLPLFDTPRFVRNLESAYVSMWQRHRAGLPPQAFAVADVE